MVFVALIQSSDEEKTALCCESTAESYFIFAKSKEILRFYILRNILIFTKATVLADPPY